MKVNKSFILGFVIGTGLMALLAFLVLPSSSKRWYEAKFKWQESEIRRKEDLIGHLQQNEQSGLLVNVMNLIDDELRNNPTRTLSDETISRISSMCYASKPYLWLEGDSAGTQLVSPERGKLLLFLCGMNLDSATMQKIKQTASFEGADLRGADLSGKDLSGVKLERGCLKDANLRYTNLSSSNLSFANFWGADLSNARLHSAIMKRTILNWATLNHTALRSADLTEATLIGAQIRNADLENSILRWADFNHAYLHESKLSRTDLFRTTFKRAQLPKAVLAEANLTLANLVEAHISEADFTNSELTDVIVYENNWIMQLNNWQVKGAQAIQQKYKIVDETSTGQHLYQLKIK
jgi:uncharacterized protein YjbI with pentapeptide repeats